MLVIHTISPERGRDVGQAVSLSYNPHGCRAANGDGHMPVVYATTADVRRRAITHRRKATYILQHRPAQLVLGLQWSQPLTSRRNLWQLLNRDTQEFQPLAIPIAGLAVEQPAPRPHRNP